MLCKVAMVALCAAALLVAALQADAEEVKCGEHAAGERWVTGPPQRCARYTCGQDGVVSAVICPTLLDPRCDKTKPIPAGAVFPACCPVPDC